LKQIHCFFFLLAEYPNFDATDDNDVIILSLIFFHGLWVKSSKHFAVYASQMNNGNKTLIMVFFFQAEKIKEKLSVGDLEDIIHEIIPGKCHACMYILVVQF